MVLLAALVVLGVVGTLMAASYFAEREGWEARLVAGRAAQLRAESDEALVDWFAQWDSAARFVQPVGETAVLPPVSRDDGATVYRWVLRVSPWSYRVMVRLDDPRDSALRVRTSRNLLVDAPRVPALGALVADGDVQVDGGLQAAAVDSARLAGCGAPMGWAPGVVVAPGAAAPAGSRVSAVASADSTFASWGGMGMGALAPRATLRIPAGAAIPAPTGAIVVGGGDLEFTGGAGSGLLIVPGRLRISGNTSFRGVILVTGGIEVSGGRFSVTGEALAAGGSPAVLVKSLAELDLAFDPCAVGTAEWHAGRLISGPPPAAGDWR